MLNKDLPFNWLIRIHPVLLNSKSYIKKIKDEEFKKFITELSWNSIIKENFSKNKTEIKIEIEK